MSAVHQTALLFFLIQFVVVLVALIAATRMADPQLLPVLKSSRDEAAGLRPGSPV